LPFPVGPSIGDTYTEAGVQYIYDGDAWVFQGQVGPTGKRSGLEYVFSTTTTAADPGAGFLRYNNATIASVTAIYIDNQDALTVSMTSWIDTWSDGYLFIKNLAGNVVNVFNVVGSAVDSSGYRTVTVTYVSGSLPSNNSTVFLEYGRFGSQGTTGAGSQGVQGRQGVQGTQGTTGAGTQGVQGTTGSLGIQGNQGITGAGTQGVQGTQGRQGTQGITGAGTQGVQGTTGSTGSQGTQGRQGTAGNTGSQGIQGLQGSQGLQGTSGASLLPLANTWTGSPNTFNLNSDTSPLTSVTGTVIQLIGADDVTAFLEFNSFGNGSSNVLGRRANGTKASPSAVTTNDILLNLAGRGYGATAYSTTNRGAFQVRAMESWTDTAQGTELRFLSTPAGSATAVERWFIRADGCLAYAAGSLTGDATINAVDYFDNGVNINTIYSSLALANIFILTQTVNLNAASAPTPTSGTILHLVGLDTTNSGLLLDTFGANPQFRARRSNGTKASPSALTAGDVLGVFNATGYGTTGYAAQPGAAISFLANQNWTDAAQGTRIQFNTTADGSTSSTARWIIGNDGSLYYSGGSVTGVSTINAVDYFDNGVNINTIYGKISDTVKHTITPTGATGGGGLVGVGEYFELVGLAPNILFTDLSASANAWFIHTNGVVTIGEMVASVATSRLEVGTSTLEFNGNLVWHAGNDGSGSGLNADLLKGKSTGTSGNTIPLLDGANVWSGASNVFEVSGGVSSVIIGSSAASSTAQLRLRSPAGQFRIMYLYTGSTARWAFGADNVTESGSDAGSNFFINSYDDAGTYLGGVLSINRATRVLNFNVTPTALSNTMWHAGNDGSGSGLDADTIRATTPSAFALTILDDASAAAMAATLGTWRVLAASAVASSHTGNTSESAEATITLPAGTLGANGILRITAVFSYTNSANTKTFRFRLGGVSGTEFLNMTQTTSSGFMTQRLIQNRNSQSSQVGSPLAITNTWGPGVTPPTGTIDTSSAQDIVISVQLANSGETATLESYVIEYAYLV